MVVVGLPLSVESGVMNCAAVISDGQFEESRRNLFAELSRVLRTATFRAASSADPAPWIFWGTGFHLAPICCLSVVRQKLALRSVKICGCRFRPAAMLRSQGKRACELSASNETIGKASWRDLVRSQRVDVWLRMRTLRPVPASRRPILSLVSLPDCRKRSCTGESRCIGDGNDSAVEPATRSPAMLICNGWNMTAA